MNSNRKTAIIVGVLYIVAMVTGVLTVAPLGSLLDGPDILTNVAANENKVIMVAFLELIMAVAVAGVAFMIYPILKQNTDTKIKEGLALWYVGTRITEGATFLKDSIHLQSIPGLPKQI